MKIEVNALEFSYDDKKIINDLSIAVDNNELVGIIGPNGSGKSTLLKLIYRTLKPLSGQIYIGDSLIDDLTFKESAQKVGVMTQTSHIPFEFTVEEIVMMGRIPHRKHFQYSKAVDYEMSEKAMKSLGVWTLRKHTFNTLSGGERQRVLMAKVLTQEPQAILLDEPTNHLDLHYQLEMMKIIRKLNISTFIVLHDINLAMKYCHKVYLMDQGGIVAGGTPESVLTQDRIYDVFKVNAKIIDLPEIDKKHIALY